MIRWFFVLMIALFVGFLIYVDINNEPKGNLGVEQGVLLPCPESPNCVSSQASVDDVIHYVEPIIDGKDVAKTQLRLEEFILRNNGVIITSRLGYLHAEITSPLLGYIDDLELYWPESDSVIHIRSASRVGYSDMNVNRERVEVLRSIVNTP